MSYSLDQLRVFVEIARSGSFTAAARRLERTQSTISFAIANLEVDLNVQLFDRTSRQALLTPAGQRLLLEAQEVLARCSVLDTLAQNISAEVESELELVSEVPLECLMPVLQAFAERFPHVTLLCHQPLRTVAEEVLSPGQARLGVMFARSPLPTELAFTQLGRLVLTHVVSAGHPLARLAAVDYADLHRYRRLSYRHFGDPLPSEAYLDSNLCWHADSDLTLLQMVCAGLGWATLPRRTVAGHLQRGELVELRQVAYPFTDWQLSVDLVWDRRHALGQAGEWLRGRLAAHEVRDVPEPR